jgi:hypothetical protein
MICRPENDDLGTPEQLEEKVPEEEETEEDGEGGEKGPVDYNALDYETMDGAGSDKDEDKFGKNGPTAAVIEKTECEIVPAGNGNVEEEFVTEIISKEKMQGKLLHFTVKHINVFHTNLPYIGEWGFGK